MKLIFKFFLLLGGVFALLSTVFYFKENYALLGPFLILSFLSLSAAFRGHSILKGFSFALLIFGAVAVGMFYPSYFVQVGDFQFKSLIVPLLQIIMFGMGTAMSLKDFAAVTKSPRPVFVGLICQFTIMPFLGFGLATIFDFPPEIAAGIILIGSSPSGLASNVMAYIGKANLALSVTLTTVATLLAPLITPLLMRFLGGQLIPIDVLAMMWGITKIVIIPIVAGLVFNHIFQGKTKWLDKAMPMLSMGGIVLILVIITASGRDNLLTMGLALVLVGFIHNMSGYFLGYWGCRLFRLDERSSRTIAFEVGMQNAGLASGIAAELGKVATLGLAPAIFGPMMNITGSSLATWWRDRPAEKET
ncbi:MAG: bile acid:sodium symporter family protein [Cyclobacteriaceae bacterium]